MDPNNNQQERPLSGPPPPPNNNHQQQEGVPSSTAASSSGTTSNPTDPPPGGGVPNNKQQEPADSPTAAGGGTATTKADPVAAPTTFGGATTPVAPVPGFPLTAGPKTDHAFGGGSNTANANNTTAGMTGDGAASTTTGTLAAKTTTSGASTLPPSNTTTTTEASVPPQNNLASKQEEEAAATAELPLSGGGSPSSDNNNNNNGVAAPPATTTEVAPSSSTTGTTQPPASTDPTAAAAGAQQDLSVSHGPAQNLMGSQSQPPQPSTEPGVAQQLQQPPMHSGMRHSPVPPPPSSTQQQVPSLGPHHADSSGATTIMQQQQQPPQQLLRQQHPVAAQQHQEAMLLQQQQQPGLVANGQRPQPPSQLGMEALQQQQQQHQTVLGQHQQPPMADHHPSLPQQRSMGQQPQHQELVQQLGIGQQQRQPAVPPRVQQHGMPQPHLGQSPIQQQQQSVSQLQHLGMGQAPPHQQQPRQQQQGIGLPPGQQQPHPAGGLNNLLGNPQGPEDDGDLRELRVEDALIYLDTVKREFKDRPAIYNEFLSIMKNFKSQEVDTPGVIDRVSRLFRGYNNLILGFNTFLPDGYKISLADLQRAEAARVAEDQRAAAAAALREQGQGKPAKKGKVPGQAKRGPKPTQGGIMPHQAEGVPPSNNFMKGHHMNQQGTPPAGVHSEAQPPQQQQQQKWSSPAQAHSPGSALSAPKPPAQPQPPNRAQQGNVQHPAVEFDHAISYVTTIKKRFHSDPNTYHSFLEILHTYQKEQRGIKEVLEQVAHLFQDHPDLLKEFTFFLPDAVQEQAKERLHKAAAESESRIAAQRQRQMDQYHGGMVGSAAQQQPLPPPSQQQHFIDMTASQMGLSESERSRKRRVDGQQVSPTHHQQAPEASVYNSAVERQFFDSAREALSSYSRDGGQAWSEFLKCLDMYAQEILSRSEMLNFVEPLLGKRNNDLFEEFKRMLTAAGSPDLSTQMIEDSWYSVPLAEIDFSRCRKCSPSYRALPRDYPAHPCSERSEEEAKVLNDIWVSLPVGSEESYTFRHMRRNTYEETLFRVEDERFEIDMVIDSNAATLQRLEAVAEEIALLSQEDILPADLGIKPQVEGAGLGGKRFQYSFDKNILGVINRNSIARIYGDSGQEMLDLLVKNPTVAVPLVVQRLRQKDSEWRAVRDRLNRHWKELAEHNYYKSLDHRSLTWRTTDKRAISTRTLIAEIKDRAANQGREGREALKQRLDKAKEEHGTFYEVTVGEKLVQDLDLTFLPKPDRRLFTPHLSLLYTNVSWAQRDAYRILAFALERGQTSPSDKERCHRLWVEFLGPWFELSLNWMQKPAVTYQESMNGTTGAVRAAPTSVVSEDDDESLDDDPELVAHMVTEELQADTKDKEFTDHHPLPAGAHVSTLYGEGKVLEFRRSDHIYAVSLSFGIGYLRPATVLCSMLPVEKSAYTRQLRADDRTKLARPNDQLAFGTQSLYLFFRLHQILVSRLNTAKRLAYSVGDDQSLQSMVEQMPNVNKKAVGRRRYEAYLSLVYALLDGGVGGAEGGKYEDRVRSLLGHGAYELATMDKLIPHIWKDIQNMANDETMWNLVQLYRRHLLAGSFQPEAFRQEAAYLSDGEPMYAFQHCPIAGNDESVLHIEYVGVMEDDEDEEMAEEEVMDPVIEPQNKRSKR